MIRDNYYVTTTICSLLYYLLILKQARPVFIILFLSRLLRVKLLGNLVNLVYNIFSFSNGRNSRTFFKCVVLGAHILFYLVSLFLLPYIIEPGLILLYCETKGSEKF